MRLGAPDALELLRAGGVERLHRRTSLIHRAALSLKLRAGLRDEAGDGGLSAFGQRPLRGFYPHKPPGEHRLALKQGVDGAGNHRQELRNPAPLLLGT
eukprot:1520281-Alexandrium_andersonii.AAC.1